MYAAPIWLQVSKNQINKIASLERKILRACSGLYRRPNSCKYHPNEKLYKECEMEPVEKELITNSLKFFQKIRDNNITTLMYDLMYNEDYMDSLHYYNSKPPIYIEYLNDTNNLIINGKQIYYQNLPSLEQYRMWQINQNED